MSRIVTDQESREVIASYFNLIESSIKTARIHMAGGAGGRPEIVDYMFEFIGSLAKHGQEFKWPDPAARLTEAARQDSALQKLIKRASKRTPIRARQVKQGGAA